MPDPKFACKCGKPGCDAVPVTEHLVACFEKLEALWKRPLAVTSGSRCEQHNQYVGGTQHSQHLLGRAIDLWMPDRGTAIAIATLARKVGFMGIGVGEHLLHIDVRPWPPARWDYP